MKNSIISSVVVTSLVLALQSSASHALVGGIAGQPAGTWVDAKDFNGAACQTVIGAQANGVNRQNGAWGGITNITGAPLNIVCPLVSDDTNGNNALPVAAVAWSSGMVNCLLQSRAPNGALVAANAQAGAVMIFPFGAVAKVPNNTYELACTLQPGQSLWGYQLQETWINPAIRTDQNI